ncbi:hypothetical protein DFJ43DRAFT_103453 [Lentinula guzmanii]|uniref:REJ domain-containing protein n=1 Tax=Lentinula guzmanii TaxID=2804957 RepID=A0AA38JLQ1_9AGAR|nr:hypothetical protein DFJ43DRAFT_103453 [Lentinula guzmanii]
MGLGLRQNPTSTSSITSGSTTDTVSSTATPSASSQVEAAPTSTSTSASSTSTSDSVTSTSESSSTSTTETSTSESLTSTVTSTSDSTTLASTSTSTPTSMSSSTSLSGSSQASDTSTSSTSISTSSTTDSSTSTSTTSSSTSSTSTSTSTSTTSTSTSTSTTSTTSSSTTTSSSSSTTSSSSETTSSTSTSSTSTSTPTSDTTTTASTTIPPPPTTTFQTTIFVTTTDSSGHTTTTAPSQVTLTSTSTSDGTVVTITAIGANPTLSTSSDSGRNSFLQNTPAVAGVSVLAGLAATSIIIFLVFYIRRRRRRARIEHDTAVSATLAAAGFTRKALDDDVDDGPASTATGRYRDSDGDPFGANRSMSHSAGSGGVLEMGQRSSSHLSGRNSAYSANIANPGNGYNPYAEFGHAVPMGPSASSPTGYPPSSYVPPGSASGPGYIPVANGERGSPVPGHSPGPSIGGSAALGERGHGHNASAGSYEPLLGTWWASQGQTQSENVTKDEPFTAAEIKQEASQESRTAAPTPPPRNPRRLIGSSTQPETPSPPSTSHQNKASDDLLGLGTLSGGAWGAQEKKDNEVNDDASSVHSNDSNYQTNVAKLLHARARGRIQGSSKIRREGTEDESLFGDHEDYSQRVGGRGVLGVRNATDLDRERSVRSSMDS